MNYQLRSLIEWAKDLKGFIELSDNDKVRERKIFEYNRIVISIDRSIAWSHWRKSRFGPCLSFIKL
jgi:hypothetical protein